MSHVDCGGRFQCTLASFALSSGIVGGFFAFTLGGFAFFAAFGVVLGRHTAVETGSKNDLNSREIGGAGA